MCLRTGDWAGGVGAAASGSASVLAAAAAVARSTVWSVRIGPGFDQEGGVCHGFGKG